MELTMAPPPPVSMDVLWMIIYGLVSSVMLILLGVIAFFLVRLVKKVDDMGMQLGAAITESAVIKRQLEDHIHNTPIHCNFPVCGRRVGDNGIS